ncbi:MAG: vitamin B12 dependent-methionine synthase activation domain-containing protein [Halanaerobiaceae bacterium]
MEILKDIDFDFDKNVFEKKIELEKYNDDLKEDVSQFLDKTLPSVKPKAIYEVGYIDERKQDKVVINNVEFTSKILRKNLKGVERVFSYIATCGNELEQLEAETEDYLEQFWVDKLKEMALGAANSHLTDYIKEKYKIEQLSNMNPGSGDRDLWPIEQQENLFSLFGNVEELIGVKLSDSFLMTPNKSVSGIYFPTEVKFESCQFCQREDCPSRRAPYKGEL